MNHRTLALAIGRFLLLIGSTLRFLIRKVQRSSGSVKLRQVSVHVTIDEQMIKTMDSSTAQASRTIVVVGGGFAGRAALRYLREVRRTCKQFDVKLLLIDEKPFFEFYPATLRCLVETDKLQNITVPQEMPDVQFIHGRATVITRTEITVELAGSSENAATNTNVKYDYCLWATGVKYAPPIQTARTSDRTLPTIEMRAADIRRHRERILEANQILIIGGGPIGVEFAAEVSNLRQRGEKSVNTTLITSKRGLLPRLPAAAGRYAARRLRKMKVVLIQGRVNQPLDFRTGPKKVSTDEGITVTADIVLDCTGASSAMKTTAAIESLGMKTHNSGTIIVTPTLQLPREDFRHLFVAGDAAYVPSELEFESGGKQCEKTAYAAEASGLLAARNIESLLKPTSIMSKKYPENAFPLQQFPRLFVISLYKNDGILSIGPIVITGFVAAAGKIAVEKICIGVARGNTIAKHCFGIVEHLGFVLANVLQRLRRSRS